MEGYLLLPNCYQMSVDTQEISNSPNKFTLVSVTEWRQDDQAVIKHSNEFFIVATSSLVEFKPVTA